MMRTREAEKSGVEHRSGEQEILRCQGLSFAFQQEIILQQLNLDLQRGDFALILGGNGSGKSTLLKLILGELQPVAGTVSLFGQEGRSFAQWQRLGYLPQNALAKNQSFPATAYELVRAHLYGRQKRAGLSRREAREAALAALARVGMLAEGNSLIGELSGGQQQRVMIAGLLAAEPELLLLDEPTAGVDHENTILLYQLLSHLQKDMGTTILMITHDGDRLAGLANRFFCLEAGNLLELSAAQIAAEQAHRHSHPPLTSAGSGLAHEFCCWPDCKQGGGKDV